VAGVSVVAGSVAGGVVSVSDGVVVVVLVESDPSPQPVRANAETTRKDAKNFFIFSSPKM
jgi:hypothetical protein